MLKQLRMQQKLRELEGKITARTGELEQLRTRAGELETALDEADTDEALNAVAQELDAMPSDEDIQSQRSELEEWQQEAENLRSQLEELNERAGKAQKGTRNMKNGEEIITRAMTRDMVRDGSYYQRADVREFYHQLPNLRAVTGGALTIPQVIVNRIVDKMGDYGKLIELVDVIKASGTTRILLSTDNTAAVWAEMGSMPSASDVGDITNIDLDGYLLAKITTVPNYMLQDSIINLDDFVTKQIAKAMTRALEDGIVNGEGSAKKQPAGIIPALASTHKVNVAAGPYIITATMAQLGLIDDGSTDPVTLVMKRKTFYNHYLPRTVQTNSAGQLVGVVPKLSTPDLLGVPVVFSNAMPDDKVLIGVFQEYALVDRESMTVDASDQVMFLQDQMAFRGKGRYDGKPKNADAFVLVTVTSG